MPKSKNRKGHKNKLNAYKNKKKVEQERMKKELYEKFLASQQEMFDGQEEHKVAKEKEDVIDTDEFKID